MPAPEALVAAAAGARASDQRPSGIPDVEALLAPDSHLSAEMRQLLIAGSSAVFRAAGLQAGAAEQAAEPAPADEGIECPPEVADLVEQALENPDYWDYSSLFRRLAARNLRVPPHLLPWLLHLQWQWTTPDPLPIIGRRGRWLAKLHPDWRWVSLHEFRAEADTLDDIPPELDEVWHEGKIEPRTAALEVIRRIDPSNGRGRVEEVFKRESPARRRAMVRALATGLSPADETFLQTALADHDGDVQAAARHLLLTLPDSGYAARMQARADAVVSWDSKKSKLDIAWPTEPLDEDWEDDGLRPSRLPDPAWEGLLGPVVEAYPVEHWQDRFGVPFAQIVAGCPKKYLIEMLNGWGRAAARHHESEHMPILFEAMRQIRPEEAVAAAWETLTDAMPAAMLDTRLAAILSDSSEGFDSALHRLFPIGRRWTQSLVAAFCDAWDEVGACIRAGKRLPHQPFAVALIAPAGLPDSALVAVLQRLPNTDEAWEMPDVSAYSVREWKKSIDTLRRSLEFRLHVAQLLPEND